MVCIDLIIDQWSISKIGSLIGNLICEIEEEFKSLYSKDPFDYN
jgi:hypothetical protein